MPQAVRKMGTRDIRDLLRIFEAYGRVLTNASLAVTYLLYLVAGMVGGWSTGLIMIFLGRHSVLAASILSVSIFIVLFTISWMASSLISNITGLYHGAVDGVDRASFEALNRRLTRVIDVLWVLSMVAAFAIAVFSIPAYYSMLRIPVAVNLGVGLGNLGMLVAERKIIKVFSPQQLFVFLYLVLTIPLYFILVPAAGDDAVMVAYSLLTVHLGLSGLIAAAWYILSARRQVLGILHAARGQD